MNTKEFIYDAMVTYLMNASADGYGQLKTMDVYAVFTDRTKEVLEYLRENPTIKVTTYGGRYGTYQGIGGIYDIKDDELRSMAEMAWKNNDNRKRNLNSW